jgi:hypothetical protein
MSRGEAQTPPGIFLPLREFLPHFTLYSAEASENFYFFTEKEWTNPGLCVIIG